MRVFEIQWDDTLKPVVWYACVHVRELPAQALLRQKPEQVEGAVVVLEGKPPLECVCSCNRAATALGLQPGMTRVEVESLPGIRVLLRDEAVEARARALLLNCVAEFTPLVQWMDCENDTRCALVLEIGGSEKLFGAPLQIAAHLRTRVRALGMIVQIGISCNYQTAGLLARSGPGIRLAKAGEEALKLGSLPVSLLAMADQQRETLDAWGIFLLSELAALPEKELVSRMGQPGRRLWLLARGEDTHHFQPIEAPFLLEQRLELDDAVEQMESLLFCLSPMLEQVIAAARDRALAIAQLTIAAGLEGGAVYVRVLRPALPTCDRALLLKLVQLDMTAHPPGAGVRSLEVTAEAGPVSKVQLGLFAPQLPEPGRLQVTLARIAAIVGEQRVGWASLEDSHREDDCTVKSFQVKDGVKDGATSRQASAGCTAVRRLRPAAVIAPRLCGRKPQWFVYAGKPYTVERQFGPWQRSGMWWSAEMWSIEYWDVVAYSPAEELLLCVLANDRLRGSWSLEAVYD